MKIIKVPQFNEWDNKQAIEIFLNSLSSFNTNEKIILDFQKCNLLSSPAIAILSGMYYLSKNKNNQIVIDEDSVTNSGVYNILQKSGLLKIMSNQRKPKSGNTLPIYKQKRLSTKGILKYIDNEIMNRTAMPSMSDNLHKAIRTSFFELFGNVFHHSDSKIGGIVCGRVDPNNNELQIVFYDTGLGIANLVRKNNHQIDSDEKAINWALQSGNTTSASKEQSRGLGLYLLTQFLKVNEGKFFIYSNKGMVSENKGIRKTNSLSHELKGSLIDLRIKITKDVRYKFSNE